MKINDNDKAQYVIDRIKTLFEMNGYDIDAFKVLHLDGRIYDWSIIINDLFITCAYAFAKHIKNKKIDYLNLLSNLYSFDGIIYCFLSLRYVKLSEILYVLTLFLL